MKEMKILVLRLHSDNIDYNEMKKIHYENDESIFLEMNSNSKQDRVFTIAGEESVVPGCLSKTIKAFEYFMDNEDFDFVIRTNISTVIDIDELKKKLGFISSKHVYGGHVFKAIWINEEGGITPEVFERIKGTEFVSGTSIILSRSMCQYILNNKHLLDYSIVDDVAIGLLMKNIMGPNLFLSFHEGVELVQNCCFYRFKTNDRKQDIVNIRNQYHLFKDKTRNNMHSF